MDLSKFTERARGVIQNAQTLATVQDHQRFMPVHLLKALMDDPEGLTRNLIERAQGRAVDIATAVEAELSKLPKVSGESGQLRLDGSVVKVLSEAQTQAQKASGPLCHCRAPACGFGFGEITGTGCLGGGRRYGSKPDPRGGRYATRAHCRNRAGRRGF